LEQSTSAGNLLTGTVNPGRIGVAGHSDGGDVTDAVVANSCCRDPRVRAAAILSGAELTSFGGSYSSPGIPLLVVQGDDDQVNPPGCSQQIYDLAGPPRYYLDLYGAGHLAPYLASGGYRAPPAQAVAYQSAVDRVTVLFWESYLAGDDAAVSALGRPADLGPTASLDQGAAVTTTGSCPGAPP
jgi:dienelactone hydrolase